MDQKKRGSSESMMNHTEIMQVVNSGDIMERKWSNYRKDFDYVTGIEFAGACDAVTEVMDILRKR